MHTHKFSCNILIHPLFLLVLSLLWVAGTSTVCAAEVNVVPRVIDVDANQRDLFARSVTVENPAPHKLTVFVTVNAIKVDEGGDITEFEPRSMADNSETVTSWVAPGESMFELDPGEVREIPIDFKIHHNAVPGEYHALIGFGSGSNRPTAEAKVRNGQAPTVLIRIAINDTRTEKLKLGKFFIDRFVIGKDNNAIEYVLSNPGDFEIVPKGEIIFYNARGAEVGSMSVNPEGISLPPGQEVVYTEDVPIAGMFGRHKAFLSVDYGSTQQATAYDTVFFYVLSWKKLTIIFALLFLLGIGISIYIYRRQKDDGDDGTTDLPLYMRESSSTHHERDINLKKLDSN